MSKRIVIFIVVLLLAACPLRAAGASDARLSGDVNGDGGVSAADAAIVLRAADGLVTLDAGSGVLADATGDMTIGKSDAVAILLLSLGRISAFTELNAGSADTLLQDRFLGRFSYQGVVRRGNSYRSGAVSVDISSFTYADAVCHLADIYIQRIESLRTEFGGGAYNAARETVAGMATRTGAILAVNGDQYTNVSRGPLVRNGRWYRDTIEYDRDVCVLYRDGVMETYAANTVSTEALRERGVYQSWVCGPRLLDENGAPMEKFSCPTDYLPRAARSAIGYYEPGHYCLMLVDSTLNPDSKGMLLEDMSQLFFELGCKAAYNLNGGMSAHMYADASGDISTPYPGMRSVSDILYITEPAA